MPYPPLLSPAPDWKPPLSDKINLWHGCTLMEVNDPATGTGILHGLSLKHARPDSDFGKGFYVTTALHQAQKWAWERYYRLSLPKRSGNPPRTVHFSIGREELADMASLVFVRGERGNDDFWSFVQHCRRGLTPQHHRHPSRSRGWYDVVVGPVAAFWRQKVAMPDADQISFHTPAALKVLDDCRKGGKPDFSVDPVL